LSTPNELPASLAEHLQPSALVAPKHRSCTGGPSRPFSYAWLAATRPVLAKIPGPAPWLQRAHVRRPRYRRSNRAFRLLSTDVRSSFATQRQIAPLARVKLSATSVPLLVRYGPYGKPAGAAPPRVVREAHLVRVVRLAALWASASCTGLDVRTSWRPWRCYVCLCVSVSQPVPGATSTRTWLPPSMQSPCRRRRGSGVAEDRALRGRAAPPLLRRG
jgi:hypothetical protein